MTLPSSTMFFLQSLLFTTSCSVFVFFRFEDIQDLLIETAEILKVSKKNYEIRPNSAVYYVYQYLNILLRYLYPNMLTRVSDVSMKLLSCV